MLVARVGVSVAMLALLISRVPAGELHELWPRWTPWTVLDLAGAVVATAAAFCVAAARWYEVSATLGLSASLPRLLQHYLAGQFVGNFLPTTIGGDVLRVGRLGRDCGDRPGAFASVVIERLTGWLVLPVLTLTALVADRGLLGPAGGRIALVVAVTTLSVLFGIVYAAEHPRLGGRVLGDTSVRRYLGAVHTGLALYRRHPAAAGRLLVVAMGYQLLLVSATATAAAAIGIRPGFGAWLAFAPMVMIVQVLPVTIGGLGVREGALVVFLGAHGVDHAAAVSLGIVLYLLNLLVSLLGAPSFAVGGGTRPVPATGGG
jgi:uncharacterized membrane protein YbhN (UPF0104 family)